MTATAIATVQSRPLKRLLGHDPTFAALGLVLVLSLAVTAPAMALDPRQFQGESIWLKPIKFQIALAIYFLTLALYARWLPDGFLRRRSVQIFAGAVVIATLGEMLWIGGAAMFGTASHFNISSPVMSTIYGVMGAFAVTLTAASLVYGIALWRNPATGLPTALRLSLGLGLVLTFVLTVPVASLMSSMLSHHVGDPITGASVPILGWSREVGDMRVPHMLATHAMHVLPVIGLIVAPLPRGVMLVWFSAAGFVAATIATLLQALAGMPLIPV